MSRERRPLSLTARLVLGAAAWCALAVAATAFVLVGLFRDHLESEADAEIADQLVQLVALTEIGRGGAVRVIGPLSGPRFLRPFSGWAWQVRRGDRVLAQSPSLGPVRGAATPPLSAPVGQVGLFDGPYGHRLRGVLRRVAPRTRSERLSFTVARPQGEIDAALAQFRQSVVIALAVLAAGLVGTVVAVMRIGLRPLADLRRRVAAMREGERPAPRPWPREIAPVAAELDALGLHIERLVSRARGLAADLAHSIKTPVSVIKAQAERLPPAAAEPLTRQAERIAVSLERHLGRSRAAGVSLARVAVGRCLDDLIEALGAGFADRGIKVSARVAPGAVFVGDEADLYEILGNPLDNARKWAASRVEIDVEAREGRLELVIADDGPGIPETARAEILRRGGRLDLTAPGHGLGLTILADLVALYGGRIELGRASLGGLSVRLDLPGAALAEGLPVPKSG